MNIHIRAAVFIVRVINQLQIGTSGRCDRARCSESSSRKTRVKADLDLVFSADCFFWGGFRSHGGTPKSSIYSWHFPWNKPSILGPPIYGTPPYFGIWGVSEVMGVPLSHPIVSRFGRSVHCKPQGCPVAIAAIAFSCGHWMWLILWRSFSVGSFLSQGGPSKSSIYSIAGIFPEINHPAIGLSPWPMAMETPETPIWIVSCLIAVIVIEGFLNRLGFVLAGKTQDMNGFDEYRWSIIWYVLLYRFCNGFLSSRNHQAMIFTGILTELNQLESTNIYIRYQRI